MGVSLHKITMSAEISKKYWFITEFRGGGFVTYPINEKGRALIVITLFLVISWYVLFLRFNLFNKNAFILIGGVLFIIFTTGLIASKKKYKGQIPPSE